MHLGSFIRDNHLAIEREWESFALTLPTSAARSGSSAMRDHASLFLAALADDLEQPESRAEQFGKSQGRGGTHRMSRVAGVHAALRISHGFNLNQLVAEYRALRATVIRLWENESGRAYTREVTRFHEALDEALAESVAQFTQTLDRYREQFLAILGHDLRTPLASIKAIAEVVLRLDDSSDTGGRMVRVVTSANRMNRMVGDLLDMTRTHLGSGIPIAVTPVDLGRICRPLVAEFVSTHPGRLVTFAATGDLHGIWDGDRISQMIGNLVGNALQHGAKDGVVGLTVRAEEDEVGIHVHSSGMPISPEALPTLFEPMVRHPAGDEQSGPSASLGLGLYIARAVALAHGGSIRVTSTQTKGTTFHVRLPRRASARATLEPDSLLPAAVSGAADFMD